MGDYGLGIAGGTLAGLGLYHLLSDKKKRNRAGYVNAALASAALSAGGVGAYRYFNDPNSNISWDSLTKKEDQKTKTPSATGKKPAGKPRTWPEFFRDTRRTYLPGPRRAVENGWETLFNPDSNKRSDAAGYLKNGVEFGFDAEGIPVPSFGSSVEDIGVAGELLDAGKTWAGKGTRNALDYRSGVYAAAREQAVAERDFRNTQKALQAANKAGNLPEVDRLNGELDRYAKQVRDAHIRGKDLQGKVHSGSLWDKITFSPTRGISRLIWNPYRAIRNISADVNSYLYPNTAAGAGTSPVTEARPPIEAGKATPPVTESQKITITPEEVAGKPPVPNQEAAPQTQTKKPIKVDGSGNIAAVPVEEPSKKIVIPESEVIPPIETQKSPINPDSDLGKWYKDIYETNKAILKNPSNPDYLKNHVQAQQAALLQEMPWLAGEGAAAGANGIPQPEPLRTPLEGAAAEKPPVIEEPPVTERPPIIETPPAKAEIIKPTSYIDPVYSPTGETRLTGTSVISLDPASIATAELPSSGTNDMLTEIKKLQTLQDAITSTKSTLSLDPKYARNPELYSEAYERLDASERAIKNRLTIISGADPSTFQTALEWNTFEKGITAKVDAMIQDGDYTAAKHEIDHLTETNPKDTPYQVQRKTALKNQLMNDLAASGLKAPANTGGTPVITPQTNASEPLAETVDTAKSRSRFVQRVGSDYIAAAKAGDTVTAGKLLETLNTQLITTPEAAGAFFNDLTPQQLLEYKPGLAPTVETLPDIITNNCRVINQIEQTVEQLSAQKRNLAITELSAPGTVAKGEALELQIQQLQAKQLELLDTNQYFVDAAKTPGEIPIKTRAQLNAAAENAFSDPRSYQSEYRSEQHMDRLGERGASEKNRVIPVGRQPGATELPMPEPSTVTPEAGKPVTVNVPATEGGVKPGKPIISTAVPVTEASIEAAKNGILKNWGRATGGFSYGVFSGIPEAVVDSVIDSVPPSEIGRYQEGLKAQLSQATQELANVQESLQRGYANGTTTEIQTQKAQKLQASIGEINVRLDTAAKLEGLMVSHANELGVELKYYGANPNQGKEMREQQEQKRRGASLKNMSTEQLAHELGEQEARLQRTADPYERIRITQNIAEIRKVGGQSLFKFLVERVRGRGKR